MDSPSLIFIKCAPASYMNYKLALCLFKLYNGNFNSNKFVQLNLNQILTSRQTVFKTSKNNVFKVGMNSLTSRITHINDTIPLTWLNMLIDTYKVHCKKLLLC